MVNLLRATYRELAKLPLTLKCLIGLAIAIEFVVITQWELLSFSPSKPLVTPKMTVEPQKAEQRAFDFPDGPAVDKAQVAAVDAAIARRMARVTIENPNVEPNGTIVANGQTIYLYGIKPFNSKQVCVKASGDKWACGLQAYATFRNSVAKKTITCEPKTILPNGVSAVCFIETTNIALALVQDGLVELDGNPVDAEMTKGQAMALRAKLGIWDR